MKDDVGLVNPRMTYAEAVEAIRANPAQVDLVRDAYITVDAVADARRFADSDEFRALSKLLRGRVRGGVVVDIGAGRGIASYAFARSGASRVIAVEPDPSDDIGSAAIAKVAGDLPIEVVPSFGEDIPLGAEIADIVYMRQVLHHAADLERLVAECARLLKPGGLFVASREHVVDDEAQLREFLGSHPIHRLAGTECAYSLERYLEAVARSGLDVQAVLGPYDSVVNAFPGVRTESAMRALPVAALKQRFGRMGRLLGVVPGAADRLGMKWLRAEAERVPGRLYTIIAGKP